MSSEITIRLSGGPTRETFIYKGRRLTQPQLTALLSEIPGIRVSKSQGNGGGFDFILVPEGASASKTALSYSNPGTTIITLSDFIRHVLTSGNAQVLESRINDIATGQQLKSMGAVANNSKAGLTQTVPREETAIEDYFSKAEQQCVRIISDTLSRTPISLRSYENVSDMASSLQNYLKDFEVGDIELYRTSVRVYAKLPSLFSTWIFPDRKTAAAVVREYEDSQS